KPVHYSLIFFTLVGLYVVRQRLYDARVVFLLVLAIVHLMVLWLLAWRIGYVSQRHTLLTVMISCILAAIAFPALGVWAKQLWHTRTLARTGLRVFSALASTPFARRAVHALRGADI